MLGKFKGITLQWSRKHLQVWRAMKRWESPGLETRGTTRIGRDTLSHIGPAGRWTAHGPRPQSPLPTPISLQCTPWVKSCQQQVDWESIVRGHGHQCPSSPELVERRPEGYRAWWKTEMVNFDDWNWNIVLSHWCLLWDTQAWCS